MTLYVHAPDVNSICALIFSSDFTKMLIVSTKDEHVAEFPVGEIFSLGKDARIDEDRIWKESFIEKAALEILKKKTAISREDIGASGILTYTLFSTTYRQHYMWGVLKNPQNEQTNRYAPTMNILLGNMDEQSMNHLHRIALCECIDELQRDRDIPVRRRDFLRLILAIHKEGIGKITDGMISLEQYAIRLWKEIDGQKI